VVVYHFYGLTHVNSTTNYISIMLNTHNFVIFRHTLMVSEYSQADSGID